MVIPSRITTHCLRVSFIASAGRRPFSATSNLNAMVPPRAYALKQEEIWARLPASLSEETLVTIAASLKQRASASPSHSAISGKREAAVLVPLCLVDEQPSILFTVRNSQLKKHAGEVSFPGGMRDPTDRDHVHTALRETEEEISLVDDQIRVLGSYLPVPAADPSVMVFPQVAFVANVSPDSPKQVFATSSNESSTSPVSSSSSSASSSKSAHSFASAATSSSSHALRPSFGNLDIARLTVSHSEVADVFTVPWRDLVNLENMAFQKLRGMWVPILNKNGAHQIWGLTAYVSFQIMWRVVLGLDPPKPDLSAEPAGKL